MAATGEPLHAADRRPPLKARLGAGDVLLGSWVSTRSPELAEVMGVAGFDVVILDHEHSEFGTEGLADMIRAVDVTGRHCLVRPPGLDPAAIGRILDAGAEGIIVPNLQSLEQARQAIAATRYPPQGHRGAAVPVRALRYGATPFADYRKRVEADLVVVLQVEGPTGMDSLDDILGVDGIDVLFIGSFDLSQHVGVPGEMSHPRLLEAMQDISARAAARGVATGTWAPDVALGRRWIEAGITLVTVASAMALFVEVCQQTVSSLRAPAAEGPPGGQAAAP